MTVNTNPQEFIICPNLIIEREDKILLLRRADWAPLFPGCWHCVTGKIEEGETPRDTIIREAKEEVDIDINPALGPVISVMAPDFQRPGSIWRDISLFFVVNDFEGEPVNKEPRLHDAMEWFSIHALPSKMIPVVRFGIELRSKGIGYDEFNQMKMK